MSDEERNKGKQGRDMTLEEMRERIKAIRHDLVQLHRTGHALTPADAAIIIWDRAANSEAPNDLAKRWECAIGDLARIGEILGRWLGDYVR